MQLDYLPTDNARIQVIPKHKFWYYLTKYLQFYISNLNSIKYSKFSIDPFKKAISHILH